MQDNIIHHYYFPQNISAFLIGSSPLPNCSQPAGIDQGPISTGEKAVLDKFSVITNALQMQIVCHDLQILPQKGQSSKARRQNLSRINYWTKSPKKMKT